VRPKFKPQDVPTAKVKKHVNQSGDPLWDLATRIVEKRVAPGDPVKSILRDLSLFYAGLKRLAAKSVSDSPLDQVRKFLSGESEVSAETHKTKRRAARSAKK
jgi:hypothetical protein